MSERKNYKFVTQLNEVHELADEIKACPLLGVDTEFIRETTFYPKIALIQIANAQKTWLIDPVLLKRDDLEPLFEILKSETCLKIIHAAYSDQECFFTSYGFLVEPVLDTAAAAALLGMGDNLGLGRLLQDLLDVNVPKGRARAKWLQRPLPSELLDYAALDVHYLVELGEVLLGKLDASGRRNWGLEESKVDRAIFEITPEQIAEKLGKGGALDPTTYLCLLELVRWREKRAKGGDLPRAWVADNETLLSLAKSKPRTLNDLRSFRGLNGREVDRSGEAILAALEKGKSSPKEEAPKFSKAGPRRENEEHLLDLLGSFVAYLAARHQVATRFLFNSAKGSALLAHAKKSPEDWVKMGILSTQAAVLIGEDLKAFLHGKKAMAIKDDQVTILEL